MIELLWNAPVSEAKMTRIIDSLNLSSRDYVLDVGCGCGEVLMRSVQRYGCRGVGIDVSAPHVEEAKRRLKERASGLDVQFLAVDVKQYETGLQRFDLVMCLGASHAFAPGAQAFEQALAQMKAMVVPGGQILIADGYLKQTKPPSYCEFIGDELPNGQTHEAMVQFGRQANLIPLGAWTSSEDEWDDFEWGYQRLIEQKASQALHDEQLLNKRTQRRQWMEAYLKWGRDTLGYGTYLFQRPE
ncbi:Demethylrebeccamycin-D-glucose O-methyltransferase [Bremerella volcania]|uniref:Demethylrebeccamycin-D-glucose O-methyltransferase n=1 Tax=Bremerella volcania TaxID=2527984 RepID=A0A518C2I6_9BACT|nr:class I SAM-dependent methyltransferase [Bremerella volcania]QDU73440.1 Demethylrebeccamycin-D-glucose O-methyltransferase [Bremerella volcania]